MPSGEKQLALNWCSRVDALADALCRKLAACGNSAFDKITIVVNDTFAENYLKDHFLRTTSRVWMNLEFIALPEMVNDWLAAQLHNLSPRRRKAAQHPYSPGVLTWRIYRILENAAGDPQLKALADYVGTADQAPLRRYMLAGKLAKLYDDYQSCRFRILRKWEKGYDPGIAALPGWEMALYRQLAKEDPGTYAKDFERAFDGDEDFRQARERYFPHCREIHVFDVPFMPEPFLCLLKKISEAIPVTFWTFNPHSEWLGETPSKREAVKAIREEIRTHRAALESGELPPRVTDHFFASPEERLFGAFAAGARAMIWNLCDEVGGDIQIPTPDAGEAVDRLKQLDAAIHCAYSPRRELEIIRNELQAFFETHPDAAPHDVAVLCADWENYAPIIEAVFPRDESGKAIPVSVAGKIAGDSPLVQVFKDLLAFSENRLEVSAVFELLSFPGVCRKFGLDAPAVEVLREMVRKVNIRWGFDDEDVCRTLGAGFTGEKPCLFTWQRGFDRMIAEMLCGFNVEGDPLRTIGRLGTLYPCGNVEGDRAEYVGALWRFVTALQELRRALQRRTVCRVEEMKLLLTGALDGFFAPDGDLEKEIRKIKKVIFDVAEAMSCARLEEIVPAVFVGAVEAALAGRLALAKSPFDAVLFSPLNTSTAMPHRFVWVCGLNDGSFPPIERRAAYDLIGEHPTWFDVTSRDKGAFALLKATLGAREKLCFSYVGKDIHTNENVSPSILLSELEAYFEEIGNPPAKYQHPMHAYSPRYFRTAGGLPASYSAADRDVAEALQKKSGGNCVKPYIAFPPAADGGITTIRLEDLACFFATPGRFLLRSRGVSIPKSTYRQLCDKEVFVFDDADVIRNYQQRCALTGSLDDAEAAILIETGAAPDAGSVQKVFAKLREKNDFGRVLRFSKGNAYNCESLTLAELYAGFQSLRETAQIRSLDLTIDRLEAAPKVHLMMQYAPVRVATDGDPNRKFLVFFSDFPSLKIEAWIWHLAVNAVEEKGVATLCFGSTGTATLFMELPSPVALERLETALAFACAPLPPENFPLDDALAIQKISLPENWNEILWRESEFIATRQANKKKRAEVD